MAQPPKPEDTVTSAGDPLAPRAAPDRDAQSPVRPAAKAVVPATVSLTHIGGPMAGLSAPVEPPAQAASPPGEQVAAQPAASGAPAGPVTPEERMLGPYELLEVAGEGGMGIVYRARHRDLGRIVALKVTRGFLVGDEDLERFRREAQVAASLDDENVVPVFDLGAHEGKLYLAMKWIEGRTLDRYLTELPGGPRPRAKEVVRTLLPAIRALGKAHRAGIVHRDIKPSNLLVDLKGQIYLADFGLAKNLQTDSKLTRTGNFVGTPVFMSPEQARGDVRRIGPPADVYGLGAMLYAIFAGRPPLEAADIYELFDKIEREEPLPLRSHWPEVPRDLQTVVAKALEKEPQRRYADAGAIEADLAAWLEDRPISARPPSAWERVRRRARAHRVPLSFAVVVCLALLTILGSWRASRLRDDEQRGLRLRQIEEKVEQARRLLETWSDPRFDEEQRLEQADLLRQAEWRLLDAVAMDPSRTDIQAKAEQAKERIEQWVQGALAKADGFLLAGDREAALKVLARIRDLAQGRAAYLSLEARAKVASGSIRVDGARVRVRFFPIDGSTLRLAAEPAFEGEPPLSWPAAPLGAYCVVFQAADGATSRLLVRLSQPTSAEPAADRRTLTVPDLPRQRDVPEGMAVIPSGPCRIGGEALGSQTEHPVDLPLYWIDRYEVTCAEYARFVAATGARPPSTWGGPEPPANLRDLPVTMVSWAEADAYARWKGKRLPSEEEWERAGRFLDGRAFPWGNDWAEARSNAGGGRGLRPPGSFPLDVSPDGVFDLAGNACEWTATPFESGQAPGKVIVRGSSFAHPLQSGLFRPEHLATRCALPADRRAENLGFRCAKDFR
ncbi:MAG: SUMF1/EgtB/PvdO family nonheme iron enzyme [Planctomycetes bacterium]|nr:SUMF1/EgtB/PvdO family nonheme iron enzyme [Planctomycetota bacterium]